MSKPFNYAFTIATVAEAGKSAVKTLTRRADGSVRKLSDYDCVTWWTFAPMSASSHEEMASCLRKLALDRCKMLVMGEPVASLDLRKPHRRQWADPAVASLCAVAREWIVLDVDDVPVPPGLGRTERLIDAARYVRDKLLPNEFIDTSMIVSPTAQSGLRGDALARMRLWFALDRAVPLADLKRWATGLRKVHDLPVDGSVLQVGAADLHGPPFVRRHERSDQPWTCTPSSRPASAQRQWRSTCLHSTFRPPPSTERSSRPAQRSRGPPTRRVRAAPVQSPVTRPMRRAATGGGCSK